MRYFSSDHHVGHENIVHNLGGGRPFGSMNHMLTVMRANIWETVTNEDTFFLIGDIAMGNFEQSILFFDGLPGVKKFVPGNHDKVGGTQSMNRNRTFTPLYEAVGLEVLPDVVTLEFRVSWGVQPVLLSHYPYVEEVTFGVDKFRKVRPVNNGLPLIHGHTHSRDRISVLNPLQFHIGVDANDFTPVSELEIVVWLESLRVRGLI